MLNVTLLEKFAEHSARCNTTVSKLHEACGPFLSSKERETYGIEDDYGGITGTILPSHMTRVAKALITGNNEEGSKVLSDDYLLRKGESVFCDIGSGTGRPTFYFGSLPIKCSIGFDVVSLHVINSCTAHSRLINTGIEFACPVNLFKENAMQLANISPVTHAYAFAGYGDFVRYIADLLVRTPTVKVFVAVVLRMSELVECGLLESNDDPDIIKLRSMQMSGKFAYMGVVIPLTAKRRSRMTMTLLGSNIQPSVPVADLRETVAIKVEEALRAGPSGVSVVPPEASKRPKRARAAAVARAAAPSLDPVGPIMFTKSQVEGGLLRGLSKWEVVAELQDSSQIKQNTTLDVWARLVQHNQQFFDAYDQFIKMRNQMQDFNDVIAKLFENTNGSSSDPGAAEESSFGQGLNNNGQPAYIGENMEGNRIAS